MNNPRNVTNADEIQTLLETRHAVHFSEDELLFELDDGGLLSIRGRSHYLYATHYPPGWRDGVNLRAPEIPDEPEIVIPSQEPILLWWIAGISLAAFIILIELMLKHL